MIGNPNMNKKVTLLLLLIAIVVASVFTACENDMAKIKSITEKLDSAEISAKNVEMLYSDSALIRLNVKTPLLNKYTTVEDPYTEMPNGVEMLFYDKNMNVNSSLKAKYSIYHEKEKIWEFKNNVELVNQQGDLLQTEHLFVDREKEVMYSQKYVSITFADGGNINGEGGFKSNFNFTEFEFTDVSGLMTLDE